MAIILSLLLAAEVPRLSVTPLEDGSFRVSVLGNAGSAGAAAEAIIDIEKAAQRHCKDRGGATGGDALRLDAVPKSDPRRKRGRNELSSIYRCRRLE